jgi:hypothetical protein
MLKPLSTTRSFCFWGDSGGILSRPLESTPTCTGDNPLDIDGTATGMDDTAAGPGESPLHEGETLLAGDTPLCGLPTA